MTHYRWFGVQNESLNVRLSDILETELKGI